jgi:hypothetical protein
MGVLNLQIMLGCHCAYGATYPVCQNPRNCLCRYKSTIRGIYCPFLGKDLGLTPGSMTRHIGAVVLDVNNEE